eukprot:PhF_6_TR14971/c0_g3_i2/m.23514
MSDDNSSPTRRNIAIGYDVDSEGSSGGYSGHNNNNNNNNSQLVVIGGCSKCVYIFGAAIDEQLRVVAIAKTSSSSTRLQLGDELRRINTTTLCIQSDINTVRGTLESGTEANVVVFRGGASLTLHQPVDSPSVGKLKRSHSLYTDIGTIVSLLNLDGMKSIAIPAERIQLLLQQSSGGMLDVKMEDVREAVKVLQEYYKEFKAVSYEVVYVTLFEVMVPCLRTYR